MSQHKNKTKMEKAKLLFKNNDIKGACRIIKTFRIGIKKEDIEIVSLAYETLAHASFYSQLLVDAKATQQKAKIIIKKFLK